MRTIKKRVSKAFLFTCLGLVVATIAFASIRALNVPDPPGRPSVYEIEADWAKLSFKKPMYDGGASIQRYTVEYNAKETSKWIIETYVQPQYPTYVECSVIKRAGEKSVAFRAFAENSVGRSGPSTPSDYITFRNPFK